MKAIFVIHRYKIGYTFATKIKSAGFMKNMVYCFICNLLLIALIMLTSCGRREDMQAGTPAHIEQEDCSCISRNDTMASQSVISDRSQKNLIRWSLSGGM